MASHHPLALEHLPSGLDERIYALADEIFSRELNEPLSTDPDSHDFYFTVPEPVLSPLSERDRGLMLSVLQCDQLSPRILSWYEEQGVPREEWAYYGADLLLRGTELAEEIEDPLGRAYVRARIWHHAAGTCYYMSPERQQIAVESIDFLASQLKDADGETRAILSVWERFIHKRMDNFLERDDEMRPIREQRGVVAPYIFREARGQKGVSFI